MKSIFWFSVVTLLGFGCQKKTVSSVQSTTSIPNFSITKVSETTGKNQQLNVYFFVHNFWKGLRQPSEIPERREVATIYKNFQCWYYATEFLTFPDDASYSFDYFIDKKHKKFWPEEGLSAVTFRKSKTVAVLGPTKYGYDDADPQKVLRDFPRLSWYNSGYLDQEPRIAWSNKPDSAFDNALRFKLTDLMQSSKLRAYSGIRKWTDVAIDGDAMRSRIQDDQDFQKMVHNIASQVGRLGCPLTASTGALVGEVLTKHPGYILTGAFFCTAWALSDMHARSLADLTQIIETARGTGAYPRTFAVEQGDQSMQWKEFLRLANYVNIQENDESALFGGSCPEPDEVLNYSTN